MTAQDLKNSILQLAIQGRLVPQDESAQPASELLKQITAEKDKIIRDGKFKKEKPFTPISEDEIPFEIPSNWAWMRLGNFCFIYNGDSINADEKQRQFSQKCVDGHSYIGTKDVGFDSVIDYENGVYIPSTYTDFKLAANGSILLCMEGGSAGRKIGILDRDVCFGNKLCCFTPLVVYNKYLFYYLQSQVFYSAFTGQMAGIIGGVGALKIKSIAAPIPPLEEQKRIVAKIEELMPYVEEYGKAEDALSILNREFPDRLRKSILQLAVQGKLVPQNDSDEPASELLKRIKTEKERLIKEGKIKKEKPLPPISEEEIPFEIPSAWAWIRLQLISTINGGFAFKSENYVSKEKGIRVLRISDFDENGFNNSRAVYHPYDNALEQFRLNEKDIIMCMTGGTVGKTLFVNAIPEPMIVNQRVADIRINELISSRYIYTVILSPYIQNIINENKNSTNDNISIGLINSFLIPLPPLEEQARIVARVDELFAICKQLEVSNLD